MAISRAKSRGFVSSLKIQSLSETSQRRLMMVLFLQDAKEIDASSSNVEIACGLRISLGELAEEKQTWMGKGIIDERWNFSCGNQRIVAPGDSTPRVRKHRDIKREKERIALECNAGNAAFHPAVSGQDSTANVTPDVTQATQVSPEGFDSDFEPGGSATPRTETALKAEEVGVARFEGSAALAMALAPVTHVPCVSPQPSAVTTSSSSSSSPSKDYYYSPGAQIAGPVTPSPEAKKKPAQKVVVGASSPWPPPKPIDPRRDLKAEFDQLLLLIPKDERSTNEKNQKWFKETLVERGFDYLRSKIVFVLNRHYKEFWAYLRDAITYRYGEKESGSASPPVTDEPPETPPKNEEPDEWQRACERVNATEKAQVTEKVEVEARAQKVKCIEDEYIESLTDQESEALRDEALGMIDPKMMEILGDAPLKLAMRSIVGDRLRAMGVRIDTRGG